MSIQSSCVRFKCIKEQGGANTHTPHTHKKNAHLMYHRTLACVCVCVCVRTCTCGCICEMWAGKNKAACLGNDCIFCPELVTVVESDRATLCVCVCVCVCVWAAGERGWAFLFLFL